MKKTKRGLLILVVGIVVLCFGTAGFCHEPRTEGESQLTFSAYMNVLAGYSHLANADETNDESSDISVDEFGVGISAGLAPGVTADALILYEEDEDDLVIDEAYLSFKKGIIHGNFGKLYIPFADAETNFVTDPFTHDLGETSESVILLGTGINMIGIEVGAFNGDSDKEATDDKIDDFFAAITISPEISDAMEISLTAAYLSDITDTELFSEDDDGEDGDGDGEAAATLSTYDERVGGISVCLSAEAKTGVLLVEYVAAEDDIGTDNKPTALNAELVYKHTSTGCSLGVKYEASEDMATIADGGDSKLERIGLIAAHAFNDKTTLKIELLRTEDDSENTLDTVGIQLEYEL